MSALEPYEMDFIRETYPDPAWTLSQIAEKLERPDNTVLYAARRMHLSRPEYFHIPTSDWESMWFSWLATGSYRETSNSLKIKYTTVVMAIKRMKEMTEGERILRWNRYRTKHGMPLFTKC